MNIGSATEWHAVVLEDLRQDEFRLMMLDTYELDPDTHPDFSSSSSPIEFGFVRGNQSAGDITRNAVIDSWSIVIHRYPCPCDCETPPDGPVDVSDFLALLANWGPCP